MLTVIRDAQDRLEGCLSWLVVDEQGHLDPLGKYVYLDQLELNPGTDGRKLMRRFIELITPLVPQAMGAYWERRDRFNGNVRGYRRDQLVKEVCV